MTYKYLCKGKRQSHVFHLPDGDTGWSVCGIVREGWNGWKIVTEQEPRVDAWVCGHCAKYKAGGLECRNASQADERRGMMTKQFSDIMTTARDAIAALDLVDLMPTDALVAKSNIAEIVYKAAISAAQSVPETWSRENSEGVGDE